MDTKGFMLQQFFIIVYGKDSWSQIVESYLPSLSVMRVTVFSSIVMFIDPVEISS